MLENPEIFRRSYEPKRPEKDVPGKEETAHRFRKEMMDLPVGRKTSGDKQTPETLDLEPVEALAMPLAKGMQPGKLVRPSKEEKPDTKDPKEDNPAEIEKVATTYRETALKELARLHALLPKTAPIAYEDRHKLTAAKTPLQIARQRLGLRAPKEQVQAYAEELCWLNDLGEKSTDKKLEKGRVIKLSGMTSNGGLVSFKAGFKTITWPDGSRYEKHENGEGQVTIPLEAGRERVIHFDPNWRAGNSEGEVKEGELVKNVFVDKKERKVTEDQFKSGRAGRMTIVDKDGSTYVLRMGTDEHYHGTRSKGGKVVETNIGLDPETDDHRELSLYRQTKEKDGTTTRTYDSGKIIRLNANDDVLSETNVDKLGRKITANFKAGDTEPYEFEITLKDKDKPIKLSRSKAGIYSAPRIIDGENVGTIEYEPLTKLILFQDKDKKRATATLEDGTTFERVILDAGHKVVRSKGKESVATTYNLKGKPILDEFTYADKTQISMHMQPGGSVYQVEMKEPGGAKTLLEADKKTNALTGFRCDDKGTPVEKAYFNDNQFMFKNLKTGAVRVEKLKEPEDKQLLPVRQTLAIDLDRGILTEDGKDVKIIRPISGGREDRIEKDGTVRGTTILGTKSYVLKNGEAAVMHDDRTGVRLNADNAIDRWGPNPQDNARGESLLPAEAKFLRLNKDVDRRDIAEIHRRFADDPELLKRFYENLIALGQDERIPAARRETMKVNILSDVASGLAYQGCSPTCNTAVVQQAMVDECPDRYVKVLRQAFAEGEVRTEGGKSVKLDRDNLKMSDSTGRNLCSRAFQTLAVQVLYDGKRAVRNHEDGTLRLYGLPFDEKSEPKIFTGLNMAQVAEVRYQLTGQEKAYCLVENVQDLITALEKYNKKSKGMTVSVCADKPPFIDTKDEVGGPGEGHVMTVTKVFRGNPEKGTATKVFAKNQWGLASHRLNEETGFNAELFLKNMKQMKMRVDGTVKTFGVVLIDGKRGTGYRMVNDGKETKAVEDPFVSAKRAKDLVLEK
jgi:hypothetical protein